MKLYDTACICKTNRSKWMRNHRWGYWCAQHKPFLLRRRATEKIFSKKKELLKRKILKEEISMHFMSCYDLSYMEPTKSSLRSAEIFFLWKELKAIKYANKSYTHRSWDKKRHQVWTKKKRHQVLNSLYQFSNKNYTIFC